MNRFLSWNLWSKMKKRKINRNPRTNYTHDFYRDPAFKKKIGDAVRKSYAAKTEIEKELHRARLAVAYRRAIWLVYGKPRTWIHEAEERLRKAEEAMEEQQHDM